MPLERRIGTTAAAALAAVATALVFAAALDRLGLPLELLQVIAALPVAAVMIAAFGARALGFDPVVRGGLWRAGAIAAAIAAFAVPASVLLAVPAGIGLFGADALGVAAAVPVGLLLAAAMVAPRIAGSDGGTVAAAIGRRFGTGTRRLAAGALLAALLPIAVAEAALAGRIVEAMTGMTAATAAALVALLAGFAVLCGGLAAVIAAGAVAMAIAAAGLAGTLAIAAPARVDGLLGLDLGRAPAPALASALALLVLLGIAALPVASAPLATSLRRSAAPRAVTLVLAGSTALLLLAALFFFEAPARGGAGLGPLLALAARPDLPVALPILLTGGLVGASIAAVAAALCHAAIAVGEDLYPALEPKAPQGRRVFIVRAAAAGFALLVALCAATAPSPVFVGLTGLGIAAAALAPVLLVPPADPGWPAPAAITLGLLVAGGVPLMAGLTPAAVPLAGPAAALGPTGPFGMPAVLAGLVGAVLGTALFTAAALAAHLRAHRRARPSGREQPAEGAN
ncbi:hypothetical protein [Prosthecomicrobium pneumaticum]|uniref:Uncharacterized protein n=1 Tax=Prosthecomicrobium pneumaticum TaxID=81895 RepID=A0A7W9FMG3_9HYPH|nr:hypothetical protein [Prosthecomicrobium pneumaticum]MBB5753392.1 hypothetical protein [Prosthecomicrobium pneumaticum]